MKNLQRKRLGRPGNKKLSLTQSNMHACHAGIWRANSKAGVQCNLSYYPRPIHAAKPCTHACMICLDRCGHGEPCGLA
jgi:hypothetical protein